MSKRLRLTLLAIGCLLMCCALAALAYALWPLEIAHLRSTLDPSLFNLP